jgi:hypothetical protein
VGSVGGGRGQKDKSGSGIQGTRVGQREDTALAEQTELVGQQGKGVGGQGDWAKFAQKTRYENIRGEC